MELEKFQIPDSYSYKGEGNLLKIKEIHTEEEALVWVEKLSEFSMITWRVSKTFPYTAESGKLYSFKKNYRCQHNTRWKSKTSKLNKNTNCPAKMSIKILRDCDIKQEESWPCIVIFQKEHNHTIGEPSSLRFRPVSNETKKEILELFQRGHTPSSAYTTFSMSKMEELGDDFNQVSSDRRFFPTKDDVGNWWQKEFKKTIGENMLQNLEQYLKELQNNGFRAEQLKVDNDYAVVLCSPFMQRAHTLKSEMIFVEATGKCGVYNHRVYMIATYCSGVGGIPLGCIISNCARNSVFNEAMKVLVNFSDIFEVKPKIIMTDDDLGKRLVLHSIFPEAIFLLSTFHILKSFHHCLLNSKNKVPNEKQQSIFQCFESLVYCKIIDEFNEEEKKLLYEVESFPLFSEYINNLLVRKKEWAHCFRSELFETENGTNDFIEDMLVIFKDKHLKCTKAFNLIQLVEFLSTSFENYYVQYTLDVIHGHVSRHVLNDLLATIKSDTIVKVSDTLYTIESETLKNVTYDIDMNTGICSCRIGTNGQMCKHQKAIAHKFSIENFKSTLTLEMKEKLFWVASGKKCPHSHFQSLISNSPDFESKSSNSSTENTFLDEPSWENSVEDGSKSPSYAYALIDDICQKLKSEISKNPETMVPAIEKFHKIFFSFSNNHTKLLSGLQSGFSDTLLHGKMVNKSTYRQGQKISFKHTGIARGDTKFKGKRKMLSRIQTDRVPENDCSRDRLHKEARPHGLSTCIEREPW